MPIWTDEIIRAIDVNPSPWNFAIGLQPNSDNPRKENVTCKEWRLGFRTFAQAENAYHGLGGEIKRDPNVRDVWVSGSPNGWAQLVVNAHVPYMKNDIKKIFRDAARRTTGKKGKWIAFAVGTALAAAIGWYTPAWIDKASIPPAVKTNEKQSKIENKPINPPAVNKPINPPTVSKSHKSKKKASRPQSGKRKATLRKVPRL
jgi:hypothetical protein